MGRQRSNNAVPTTISSLSGTAGTSGTLAATTGWPAASTAGKTGFVAVIEPGTSNQEVVYVNDRSGASLTNIVRNFDGNGAFTHANGSVITHEVVNDDYNYPMIDDLSGTFTAINGTLISQSVTIPPDCRLVEVMAAFEMPANQTSPTHTISLGGVNSFMNTKRVWKDSGGNAIVSAVNTWFVNPPDGSQTFLWTVASMSTSATVNGWALLKKYV